ncbi:MAG: hypothetical protein BMS9Abin26_0033 [Gammaproteobacteria bacterium]|nr:MAG: hypothetical protein BMS9Abin26_0033 [Gammaproteobacteria bacterium]
MERLASILLVSLLLPGHIPISSADKIAAPMSSKVISKNTPTVIPTDKGSVSRALFTTMVKQREPLDEVVVLEDGIPQVYFFTELRQLKGKVIVHRWEYNGKVVSEVAFKVGGNRWRVYSKKSLRPDQQGKWTVVVVDDKGWPYRAAMFQYGEDTPASEPPEVIPPARVSTSIPE